MPGNIIPLRLDQPVLPDSIESNSMLSVLKRGPGFSFTVKKRLTLAGAQCINIFKVLGVVQAQSLFGLITSVTALTDCTAIHFDLWDGTVSTKISKDGIAAISGLTPGSGFYKPEVLANDLTVVSNAAGAISEFSGKDVFQQFVLMQKLSTDTFIRFCYTAGAAIDVDIYFSAVLHLPVTSNYLLPIED